MDHPEPGLTDRHAGRLLALGEEVAEAQDRLRRKRAHVATVRRSFTELIASGEAFAGLRARRSGRRLPLVIGAGAFLVLAAILLAALPR